MPCHMTLMYLHTYRYCIMAIGYLIGVQLMGQRCASLSPSTVGLTSNFRFVGTDCFLLEAIEAE